MTVEIKRWLCDQFVTIDSVRTAKIQGDLIAIHTWSGVVIYAYVLEEPTKARTIKRIVQENTRIGIGTLFIVSAKIVPEDGARVEPDEGLLALHALFKDKFYTYRIQDDGEPRIGQVHFKAQGEVREVWYGPDITIGHLPSYRVWVNAPQSIKGNWMIANFGSDAFWKQADYTIGRDAFRQQQQRRATDRAKFRFWSQPSWGAGDETGYMTPAPPPEAELDRFYKQLGLTNAASDDEVKAAFRRLAREVHPDVSDLPKEEAELRFNKLYEAYAFIKTAHGF
jgi:DnaJ domain